MRRRLGRRCLQENVSAEMRALQTEPWEMIEKTVVRGDRAERQLENLVAALGRQTTGCGPPRDTGWRSCLARDPAQAFPYESLFSEVRRNLAERALGAEIDFHVEHVENGTKRNGHNPKTVNTDRGTIPISAAAGSSCPTSAGELGACQVKGLLVG